LLRAYYRSLANECRRLPLGVVDPRFVRPQQEGQVSLPDVYVDLAVVSPVRGEDEDMLAWGLRLARGEGAERTPLLDAIAEPAAAHAVLLGDPGSGKTTFVNYLTYLLAASAADGANVTLMEGLPEEMSGRLPIRILLRSVAVHISPQAACGNAGMLWDALRSDIATRLGETAAAALFAHLQEHLLGGESLFLLDGLDEVPEAGRRRRCLLEAISDLVSSLPVSARVLLTARPYAYADPLWRLADFPILALAPFDEGQVNRFVERWCQAVRPALGWDATEAQERARRLTEALAGRPYLADLASRPLLLTLMATLHSSWGQLPDDRADLYEETIKLLLARWQQRREITGPEGKPLRDQAIERALGLGDRVRVAVERLAWQVHSHQGQERDHDDAAADITRDEVLAAFSPLLPDDVNPTVLLTYLETWAGLLIGRREGVYAFPHRSFQEYLAACHLANTEREFAEKLRELVWQDPTWWREVFLLGVGKKRQGGLGDAVNVINTLVPEEVERVKAITPVTETHWRAAVLAGQASLDLRLLKEAGGRPHYEATLGRVRRWLAALVQGGYLPPAERLVAGDVLGELGDPRPGGGHAYDRGHGSYV
jgi:predicted NACHT family NTPase